MSLSALGTKITGVEQKTFSSIGAPFSSIVPPNSETHATKVLQQEDVSLSYDFISKYPGFTPENL